MALIEIKYDLFYLAQRIKQIDDGYFIAFNTKSKHFEVHNNKQPLSTFCLRVPNDSLNPSLLEYVRKTRCQNQKKLLEEMEKSNQKLEMSNRQKILDEAEVKFEELFYKRS